MFKISKIDCTVKPSKFENLNNGVWYYNFDVTSETRKDMEDKEVIVYKYSQVRIQGIPNLEKCYEAVLKSYTDENGNTLYSATSDSNVAELLEDLYEMVQIDLGLKDKPSNIEVAQNKVIRKINKYDTSADVNSFYLNGLQVWLDKSTRVGLMNSLTIEKNTGKETSTLWFGNLKLDISTDAAIQMLSALELYALECYNVTAEHKAKVKAISNIDSINSYNYTIGYPDKLKFNI